MADGQTVAQAESPMREREITVTHLRTRIKIQRSFCRLTAILADLPIAPPTLRTRDSAITARQRAVRIAYRAAAWPLDHADPANAYHERTFLATRAGRREAAQHVRQMRRALRTRAADWAARHDQIADGVRATIVMIEAANAEAHAANKATHRRDREELARYREAQAAALATGQWSALSEETLRDTLGLAGYSIREVSDRYRCCVAARFTWRGRYDARLNDIRFAGWDDNGQTWSRRVRETEYGADGRPIIPSVAEAMAESFECPRDAVQASSTVRQGDVLFVADPTPWCAGSWLPEQVGDWADTESDRCVIRDRHVVTAPGAAVFASTVRRGTGELSRIYADSEMVVVHPEHAWLRLAPGAWRIYTTRGGHGD